MRQFQVTPPSGDIVHPTCANARPGGNITGLSNQSTDLPGKRLELLRAVVPGLHRVAVMANVATPIGRLEMDEVKTAARALDLEIIPREIRKAEDIGPLQHRPFHRTSPALAPCLPK